MPETKHKLVPGKFLAREITCFSHRLVVSLHQIVLLGVSKVGSICVLIFTTFGK